MMTIHSPLVFLVFLLLFVATMGGHLYSPDDEVMFRTTESLAMRGTLAIEPITAGFATAEGRDGRQYGQYGVGQPLLAVPLYWIGAAFDGAGEAIGRIVTGGDPLLMIHHDGAPRDWSRRFAVSLFNQIIAALLCAVLFAFVRDLTGSVGGAWIGALMLGLGTYGWGHSKAFFSEPLCALLVLGAFYALHRGLERRRIGWFIFGGSLYGYALLVRLDTVFFGPGLAAFFLAAKYYDSRRAALIESAPLPGGAPISAPAPMTNSEWFRSVAAALIPTVLGLAAVFTLNYIRYGAFFSTGYEDQPEGIDFGTPLLAGMYGFLFSAGKGFFFFSPPLILIIWAARPFARRWPVLAWGLFTAIAVFFLVQCKWRNFAGGWCWGPRHIFQLTPLLALPVAVWLALEWLRPTVRIAAVAFITIGIAVQLLGTSQNFISYYVEFYRTPEDGIYFTALYDTMEAIPGEPPRIAPINDSVYVPPHTQWRGNIILLKLGRHDYFWLNTLRQ